MRFATMRDGVRIALDVVLPDGLAEDEKVPTLLVMTSAPQPAPAVARHVPGGATSMRRPHPSRVRERRDPEID
jgi:predicted acyl esterase